MFLLTWDVESHAGFCELKSGSPKAAVKEAAEILSDVERGGETILKSTLYSVDAALNLVAWGWKDTDLLTRKLTELLPRS